MPSIHFFSSNIFVNQRFINKEKTYLIPDQKPWNLKKAVSKGKLLLFFGNVAFFMLIITYNLSSLNFLSLKVPESPSAVQAGVLKCLLRV